MTPRYSRAVSIALGSLCAAWFLGVVCAVHVSAWQAPPALMVFGADRVQRGTTAGFRAVAHNSASRLPVAGARLEAWLEDDRQTGTHSVAGGEDAVAWTLPVPDFAGGEARLVVRLLVEKHAAGASLTLPLKVVDGAKRQSRRLMPLGRHAPSVAARAPGVEVSLVPLGGRFAIGLVNPGLGLVLKDGLPWPDVRVRCRGLALDTRTDADGLFDFSYTPPLHPEPLHVVVAEDAAGWWTDLQPRAYAAQFQMLVPTQAFAQSDPQPLHVDALPLRQPLAVDLWFEDLLLGTTALPIRQRSVDATLGIKTTLPAGFLTLVAFRHVLAPGFPATATRPLGASAQDPLTALAQAGAHDPWWSSHASRKTRTATFALARVQPEHGATPVLHDDTEAVYSAFAADRQQVLGSIYRTMGGLMGVSLGAIALAVWQMQRRRRQMMAATLAEIPEESRVDADAARRMGRITDRVWLLLAVGALAMSAYGLMAVVVRLKWR